MLAVRPVIVVEVPVTSCGPAVQLPVVPARYCTSYDAMAGRPVLPGAVQLTARLVVLAPVTVGVATASGASSWSLSVIVTSIVPVPALPSSAFTVTE